MGLSDFRLSSVDLMVQVEQLTLRRDPRAKPYVALREAMIAARKAAGLTQQELADRLDRPQSFIAKVETGERYLDVVEFVAIAHVLDSDITDVTARIEHQLYAQ